MTALRQKMIEDMQLRGLAERTQQSYVAAGRGLAEYYGKVAWQLLDRIVRFAPLMNHNRIIASNGKRMKRELTRHVAAKDIHDKTKTGVYCAAE